MPDIKQLDQLLEEQFGFKPVPKAEVERVEASVKTDVVEPVSERLNAQQSELERVRAWYLAQRPTPSKTSAGAQSFVGALHHYIDRLRRFARERLVAAKHR